MSSIAHDSRWKHLKDDSFRAALTTIRDKVEPVLANNVLRHFTDHSVTHSDSVAKNVDRLLENFQQLDNRFEQKELFVLYAACYLHDIGMHYENASATTTIQEIGFGQRWKEISDLERIELLRTHHHKISAEIVHSCLSSDRLIGLHLDSSNFPSEIACICESHCIDVSSPRYSELMDGHPGFRMRLIAGILRLADILDEASHRACREKARTLELDDVSQMHWWRHYYTKLVEFNSHEKRITVWFEFPVDRNEEYLRVIPKLQTPWIENEFRGHNSEFSKFGFQWAFEWKSSVSEYSSIEAMPDGILVKMLNQLRWQSQQEQNRNKQVVVEAFNEARPHVQRRLDDLRAEKEKLAEQEYLLKLTKIAEDLWEIGSKRSAWICLTFEYQKLRTSLPLNQRVTTGTALLQMLIEDEAINQPVPWLPEILEETNDDLIDFNTKTSLWETVIRFLICAGEVDDARKLITDVKTWGDQLFEQKMMEVESQLDFLVPDTKSKVAE